MFESLFSQLNTILQSDIALMSTFGAWLATFLLGENGALVTFTLLFQSLMSPQAAIAGVFLGSLSADLFWYMTTATAIKPWYLKRQQQKQEKNKTRRSLVAIAESHPYFILVLIKFLVGLRLFLTIYIVTKKHIPFWTYLVLNVLANILFVVALLGLSWSLSLGAEHVLDAEKSISTVVTMVVLVALFGNVALRFLTLGIERLFRKDTSAPPA